MSTRLAALAVLTSLALVPGAAPAIADTASSAAHDVRCPRTLAAYPILHPGARRPAVRTLQCALNDLGLGPVVVDGWYGPQTRAAVTEIEDHFEGDPPHPGRIDNGFWVLLYGRQLPRHLPQYGDRRHAVRVLQRALRAAGADIVVDGWFGPQTRGVVRAYQRRWGQPATGRVTGEVAFELAMGGPFGRLS